MSAFLTPAGNPQFFLSPAPEPTLLGLGAIEMVFLLFSLGIRIYPKLYRLFLFG